MAPTATYRGRWTTNLGTGVLTSDPIPVNAGDALVVAVIADSYQGLTTASVSASTGWGFNHQTSHTYWGNVYDGAYAGIFAAIPVPANGSPTVTVTTGGSAQGHKRPSFEVWTITGYDPGDPVAGVDSWSLYGNPINATLRSAAGTAGGTVAIISAGDGWGVGDPYVSGDGINPGNGYTQPTAGGEPGISGFSTAALWSTPDTNQSVTIDPPGSSAAVYSLVFMEFRATLAPPTVNAGADASHTYGPPFTRTATETGGGAVTSREWKIVSGPAGAGSVIGTAQALSWSPTASGVYVLRYTATNSTGANSDDATITVVGTVPAVNAGPDRSIDRTLTLPAFTATETSSGGSAITARQWKIQAGPAGVGTVLGTAALCPPLIFSVAGAYTLRYSATNATGTGTDDMIVTVAALRPVVDAGPDEARGSGPLTRTAQEAAGDSPITSRQWKIMEGPTGVGTVIGTAAALSWTPPSLGRWVLRYTATSAAGSSTDDAVISVGVTGVPLRLARTPAPRLAVAIAFGGNLSDPDGSDWAFTEVTTDVRIAQGVHLRHGRSDEAAASQPAQCSLTLDNRTGRYSLGGRSPYWPNVRQGTPVQVSCDLGSGFQTLFTGYADGFTPGWSDVPLIYQAGGGGLGARGDAVVTLSASGTLRRLAQGDPPQISPLRRGLTNSTGVVAYWPCEDGEGARQLASAFPGAPAMDFSGRLHGGSNPGLPPATPRLAASDVFACSDPLPLVSDSEWYGTVPDYTGTEIIQMRCLIDVPSAGSNDGAVILGLITTGDPGFWELRYIKGGGINVRAWRNFSSLVLDSPSILLVPGPYGPSPATNPPGGMVGIDGRRGQLGLTLTKSGGNIDWVVDFIEQGANVGYVFGPGSGGATVAGASVGKARRVQTCTDGGHVDVTLGHVVVRKDARDTAAHIQHLNAWSGENVGQRLLRLTTENVMWYVQYDGTVYNVAVTDYMGPQPSGTLLDLLRSCETCDQGILWDGVNPGVSYTTKRYRESRAPKLTLNAAAGEVAAGFVPIHDDAYRVNRAVAQRRKGSNAVYEDQTGPLGWGIVGRYEDSLTTDVIADSALIQYAAWMVHQGTCEGYRYPQLGLNLTRHPELLDEWLTIIPGDRVDVANLATVTGTAPVEPVALAVEGFSQTITSHTWDVIMNTSLYRRWSVAQVCSETGDTREFGARVDTNGSTMAALTAAGQATLDVIVSAGPLWTTQADDYPLLLDVGAVSVRATACTAGGVAGNASRQSFTIDPMPVTRPAGTAVQLWNPPVFAL